MADAPKPLTDEELRIAHIDHDNNFIAASMVRRLLTTVDALKAELEGLKRNSEMAEAGERSADTEVERLRAERDNLMQLLGQMALELEIFSPNAPSLDPVVLIKHLKAGFSAAHSRAEGAEQAGYVKGLTAYAWWKDGVQYVGTCGTTLDEAILKGPEGE